jgi:hypothetical protein
MIQIWRDSALIGIQRIISVVMKIAQVEQRPQKRDCSFNLQLYIPYVSASAGGGVLL